MKSFVRKVRFGKRDEGASAVAYGLLVALIAVIISVGVFALGGGLNKLFNDTNTCISSGTAC